MNEGKTCKQTSQTHVATTMAYPEQQRKKKQKKKNNFLRDAKKLGKKGHFGKGKRLSEEEYNYYIRVYEQLKHAEGEDREILVRNFFRELQREGQEKSLAGNQIISRVLDHALPMADVCQVVEFTRVFKEDIRSTCVDPFASHVMQTLLALALKYSQENATQMRFEENEETNEVTEKSIPVTKEVKEEFISFIEKISKFVYNNLEDFIWDTYASHIICSIIMVCSAVDVQNIIKSKQKSQSNHGLFREEGEELKVPAVLSSVLPDIAERFTRLPDISGIVTYNCSSVVAQTLLLALYDTNKELCHAVVSHILDHGFIGISPSQCDQEEEEGVIGNLPLLFQSNSATRLLEVLIKCSSSTQQKLVFDQYLRGHIKALVQSKHCNFAVQRILTCWKDKENFEDVFNEASKTVEVAASTGHTGTIVSLAQACRQLSSNQWQCMEAVMEFLDCNQPDRHAQFVPLLLRMMKFDEFQKKKVEDALPSTTLHGSLILQEFLQFNKPSKVVKSLLEMTTSSLQELACDMRGSHVISAYFASKFVGAKNHEKMVHKFKGTFTALACCKSGSRSLDDMWKGASIKMKTLICSELVEDELKLKENTFGKFIFSNFMVSLFRKKDKSDWQELLNRQEKKRKMFDDLLKEVDSDVPKKKKKKNEKSSVDTKAISEDDIFLDVEGDVEKEEFLSE